jgi:hypothetical protein
LSKGEKIKKKKETGREINPTHHRERRLNAHGHLGYFVANNLVVDQTLVESFAIFRKRNRVFEAGATIAGRADNQAEPSQ